MISYGILINFECNIFGYFVVKLTSGTKEHLVDMIEELYLFVLMLSAPKDGGYRIEDTDTALTSNRYRLFSQVHFLDCVNHAIKMPYIDFLPCIAFRAC